MHAILQCNKNKNLPPDGPIPYKTKQTIQIVKQTLKITEKNLTQYNTPQKRLCVNNKNVHMQK